MTANRMGLWALETAQAEELRDRLGYVIADGELDRAVAAIDMGVHACGATSAKELAKLRALSHRHMTAVYETASRLGRLLDHGRPGWGIAWSDRAWLDLEAALKALAESAHVEATASESKPLKRRPPDELRDDLIAIVASVYPPGTAELSTRLERRKNFSHMVGTVGKVLSYIDSEPANVRALVVHALRRRPEPPFRVIDEK